MNYSIEQIKRGVAAYLDNEFMPMFDEGSIKKVIAGAAISLAITRYSAMADLLLDNQFVKALGVVDENRNVDVDTLAVALKQNMPKDGVKVDVPSMGAVRLKGDDIDKLKQYIAQTAK